ncbi:transmembrane protein 115 [Echinococcus multilocularis]|uniref:Transmembrane protein 115 n=1 Tax=Echinococcus multilocularis TaxID=6211 RepID=A0A068Y8S2_ECHMU|nr:transmembrane protein 115 [Echinococcus multilocularis]
MTSFRRFHLDFWAILTMVLQITFYGVSFTGYSTPYLAVTVARVLPPHCWIWTLLTFSFYNTRILHVFLDMTTVYLVDVVMFPSWKMTEVVRCCAISQLVSTGLAVCTLFIGYACTFDTNLLWKTPICGLSPLLGAALVVARQLTPNNVLANLPLGKFRTKHIAFTIFFCFLLFAILRIIDYIHFLLLSYGAFVTWVYLRFFQRHSNGDIGDTTDAFKFSGFFPNHLEPPVSIASNAIYNLLVKLHLCRSQMVFDLEYSEPPFTVRVVANDGVEKLESSQVKQNTNSETYLPKEISVQPSSADVDLPSKSS